MVRGADAAKIRKSSGEIVEERLIYAAVWFIIAIKLYPFIYVISMSISNPIYIVDNSVWLYPKGFSAMDDRVGCAVVSGYFYGYKDSLLKLSNNCGCNYVPSLWK